MDRISANGMSENYSFSNRLSLWQFVNEVSDCLWRQHWSCGVSGKRIRGAFTSSHTYAHAGTQQHTGSILVRRERSCWFDNLGSQPLFYILSRLLTDGLWRRRMTPGPAEPSGVWGPRRDPPCTGKRTTADRLQEQPARDRMSSTPEESHSRGGGSDTDLKMASSNNTTPDGGPPPPLHQNRIRQVGVCLSAARSLHWLAQPAV